MAGLMAATMSTCDIYLVSGVNQLVRDVAQYFLKIRDTKKLLQWAKWGTIIYGMASVAFCYLLERWPQLPIRIRYRRWRAPVRILPRLLATARG